MAKSKIQFQKGYSLFEFLKDYGIEAQCETRCSLAFSNGSALNVPTRPVVA